jgi:hypothetical protein
VDYILLKKHIREQTEGFNFRTRNDIDIANDIIDQKNLTGHVYARENQQNGLIDIETCYEKETRETREKKEKEKKQLYDEETKVDATVLELQKINSSNGERNSNPNSNNKSSNSFGMNLTTSITNSMSNLFFGKNSTPTPTPMNIASNQSGSTASLNASPVTVACTSTGTGTGTVVNSTTVSRNSSSNNNKMLSISNINGSSSAIGYSHVSSEYQNQNQNQNQNQIVPEPEPEAELEVPKLPDIFLGCCVLQPSQYMSQRKKDRIFLQSLPSKFTVTRNNGSPRAFPFSNTDIDADTGVGVGVQFDGNIKMAADEDNASVVSSLNDFTDGNGNGNGSGNGSISSLLIETDMINSTFHKHVDIININKKNQLSKRLAQAQGVSVTHKRRDEDDNDNEDEDEDEDEIQRDYPSIYLSYTVETISKWIRDNIKKEEARLEAEAAAYENENGK